MITLLYLIACLMSPSSLINLAESRVYTIPDNVYCPQGARREDAKVRN